MHYIVRGEHHENDFFAIKFYPKPYKKSDRKYSVITNRGDVPNIQITCAKVAPEMLKLFPKASFGFLGSRSIDYKSNKAVDYSQNQRFRIYSYHIPQLIGNDKFVHKSYKNASAYLLVNKSQTLEEYTSKIKTMIIEHYEDVLNLG